MLYVKRRQKLIVSGVSVAVSLAVVVAVVALGMYVPDEEYLIPLDTLVNNLFAVAMLTVIFPSAVVGFFNLRYRRSVEQNIPRFLRSLMDDVHAGLTLPRAIEEASKRDFGPVSGEAERALSKFIMGKKFEDCMRDMAVQLHHPQADQVATILVEAHSSGGRVSETLKAATDVYASFNEYREDRRAKMKPYTYLIYMAVLIFLVVSYIALYQFLMPLAGVSGTPLFQSFLSIDYYVAIFFWASILEGLFGGLVGGKISEGMISAGLLHSTILVVIPVIFFNLFIF
jgi:flagellar protein FlaJ